MAQQRHGAAFIVGAIIGGIAGAAATLWTTPRSGQELRTRMMGAGDDSARETTIVIAPKTEGREERLSSRALGLVERVAAPLVGVRLGETAVERRDDTVVSTTSTASTVTTDTAETEEIVLAPGEASGEPPSGDSGIGHAATAEELSGPVPGALDQAAAPEGSDERFTPFPHSDQPPNQPQ
ncbi:MAG: hypothetical protein M3121_05725 [Chloroflexota bacterium]|nr:hypothetical protein [Chloroflexota bacterium]